MNLLNNEQSLDNKIHFSPEEIKGLKLLSKQLTEKHNKSIESYFTFLEPNIFEPKDIEKENNYDKTVIKEFVLSFSDEICEKLG
jgi:hypothetical protein